MGSVEKWKPQPLERLTPQQVKFIANTEIIPKPLRGRVDAIIATIAKGRALGLDDIHALSAIHFIEGKPTLSAEAMNMLARRAGHSIAAKVTETSATVKGVRADTGDSMEVTYTLEDAKRAGILGKDNWKKHPQAMLMARATAQLCRWLFPDVLAGASYTPEELEDASGVSPPAVPELVAADAAFDEALGAADVAASFADREAQAGRPGAAPEDVEVVSDEDASYFQARLAEVQDA